MYCDKCTNEFITDIDTLCDNCPILNKVKEVATEMIVLTENLKAVNNNDYLIDYYKEKIKKGNSIIEDMVNGDFKHTGDNFRQNRIALLLSWKDSVKYYTEQLQLILRGKPEALPPQQTEPKTYKLKAPVLGLFCNLINKIGIDEKGETESATVYCERICNKFRLPYTDRVRQNYNVNENKKLIKELTEKVLPLIDNKIKTLVQEYLDNKQPLKQNLYA
jgi:hypothetical protein